MLILVKEIIILFDLDILSSSVRRLARGRWPASNWSVHLWNKVPDGNVDLEVVFVEMIFEVLGEEGTKEK